MIFFTRREEDVAAELAALSVENNLDDVNGEEEDPVPVPKKKVGHQTLIPLTKNSIYCPCVIEPMPVKGIS